MSRLKEMAPAANAGGLVSEMRLLITAGEGGPSIDELEGEARTTVVAITTILMLGLLLLVFLTAAGPDLLGRLQG